MSPLLRFTDRPWLVAELAVFFGGDDDARCRYGIVLLDLPSAPRTSRWTHHHEVRVQVDG